VVGGADGMTVKEYPQSLVCELLMLLLQGVGQGGDEAVGVVGVGVGEEQVVAFFLGQGVGLDEDVFDRVTDGPAVGGAKGADLAFAEPATGRIGGDAFPRCVGKQIDDERFMGIGGLLT